MRSGQRPAPCPQGNILLTRKENVTEGESEKILGRSLKNLNIARQDVMIATVVDSRVGPGRNDIGASRG